MSFYFPHVASSPHHPLPLPQACLGRTYRQGGQANGPESLTEQLRWGNAFPKWGLQICFPFQPVSMGNPYIVTVPFALGFGMPLEVATARDRLCHWLLSFHTRRKIFKSRS